MSVLIKDIRIPESCSECRFCINGFTDDAPMYECACQSYDNVSVIVEKDGQPFDFRPEWCPLIEVKSPHGRLIDADKLMRDIEDYHLSDGKFQHWVEVQQTVIEAEGSENERREQFQNQCGDRRI